MRAQEKNSAGEASLTSKPGRTSTSMFGSDGQAWSKQRTTSLPLGKTMHRVVDVNVDVEACAVASREAGKNSLLDLVGIPEAAVLRY